MRAIVRSPLSTGGKLLGVVQDMGKTDGPSSIRIGESWSPMEFIERAKGLEHPFNARVKLPPQQAKALYEAATLGPSALARKRTSTLEWYRGLAEELAPAEARLHAELHAEVETVVADKRILLFKAMLKDINYDDLEVADLLVTGVKLIGELPALPFWQSDPSKLAKITTARRAQGACEKNESKMDSR